MRYPPIVLVVRASLWRNWLCAALMALGHLAPAGAAMGMSCRTGCCSVEVDAALPEAAGACCGGCQAPDRADETGTPAHETEGSKAPCQCVLGCCFAPAPVAPLPLAPELSIEGQRGGVIVRLARGEPAGAHEAGLLKPPRS